MLKHRRARRLAIEEIKAVAWLAATHIHASRPNILAGDPMKRRQRSKRQMFSCENIISKLTRMPAFEHARENGPLCRNDEHRFACAHGAHVPARARLSGENAARAKRALGVTRGGARPSKHVGARRA